MSTCPHCNGDGEEPGAPISETETATCSTCHGTGSTTTQHTPGALKVAAIILGDDEYIFTTYGRKNINGLADLIDRETAAPDLLEALQRAEKQLAIAYNPSESPILELCRSEAQQSCNQARAAIAKATPIQPRKGN